MHVHTHIICHIWCPIQICVLISHALAAKHKLRLTDVGGKAECRGYAEFVARASGSPELADAAEDLGDLPGRGDFLAAAKALMAILEERPPV